MKRTLQKTNKDQYILTIPKSLCEIKKWNGGDEISFSISKNNKIIIEKLKGNIYDN